MLSAPDADGSALHQSYLFDWNTVDYPEAKEWPWLNLDIPSMKCLCDYWGEGMVGMWLTELKSWPPTFPVFFLIQVMRFQPAGLLIQQKAANPDAFTSSSVKHAPKNKIVETKSQSI